MRFRRAALAVSMLGTVIAWTTPAVAGAKAIQRYKAVVDGQTFKVVRYDNGTVKVIDAGVFGPAYSYNLRDQMRQAAKQATGCDIADDFDQDGKLIGKLVCTARPAL